MSISWTSPSALWLLAVIPLIWIALRFARTNFNPRQRLLQTIIRSLLLALIVLALARPVISAGSSKLSVVYLVDISHSIAPAEIEAVAKKIDELNASVKPAHWRIVAFGKDAATVDSTESLRKFSVHEKDSTQTPPPVPINRVGTDLDAALSFARASLSPGALPRIVLFSDGRSTAGDTHAAVARLHANGVPVSVFPLLPPDLGDTWIDSITVPARISSGATFAAVVHVTAQKSGNATVELRALGKLLGTRTLPLIVGTTPVSVDVKLDSLGAQALEATVTMAGDPVAVNNRLDHAVWVAPRPRILYFEGVPSSARYLSGALNSAGFDVIVGDASSLNAAALAPLDVVILSDVSRAALSDPAQKALAQWVEESGGGLLIAGGENVFGEGPQGYRKTELERIAPVTFERRDEPEVALVIVLDKSWSMNGAVMELCKAAAQAAVDALTDEQSVGVVTFNDGYNWDVRVGNVGKRREEIRTAISAIQPSGQTLIYTAVEQAGNALKSVKARAKHVVLLSDGRSTPDDYEALVKKMVESKITVSSIAVGQGADAELLSNIAKWGKGRSYLVQDAREVPQIFVKEAKEIPNLAFDEKRLVPVVKHRGFLDGVDLSKAPSFRGRTSTVIKDSALELLSTRDSDPLLAFWPAGLGRVAVFTSDVKDRWASEWVTWRGYGSFFSAVLHALQRQRPPAISLAVDPGVIHGTSSGQTRTIGLSIDAHDDAGKPRDFLAPRIRVQSGTKPPIEIAARQTSAGHYEARAIVDAGEPFAASVVGNDAGITSGVVLPDTNEEYRFRSSDETELRSIAAASKGQWKPTAETLASTAGEKRPTRRPLWPWLLWTGLMLWLGDLVLRRVRILEKT